MLPSLSVGLPVGLADSLGESRELGRTENICKAPTAPEFSSAELLQWLKCLGRMQEESGASHHLPLKAHVGLEEIPHAAGM